jgi:hypothetical protein
MARNKLHIIFALILLLNVYVSFAQAPVFEVARLSFSDDIYSDISPVILKDGIIFCSNRRFSGIKDRTAWDGHRLYNIYMAQRKDSSDWTKPKELKSDRSALFNNGPLCVSPDGKTVYFTSEVETGSITRKRNFKNHSGIFIAELSGSDLVSMRPFKYNSIGYEVGQPSLSSDGKTLFFASDMPGGQGGADLYYCNLVNGEWSVPVNLGSSVNSPDAENYPSMHPSGRLFFTSDRKGGFGGLDVYNTTQREGKWEDPVILPEPINSKSDDFAYVAEENLQSGYFASDRRRNDDVYRFSSLIIRKSSCDELQENNYCFEFFEENAVNNDSIPFRYDWKFGDGSTGTGSIVDHCFTGPGTYLVQLDVVNLLTKEVLYNQKSYTLEIKNIEQPYISVPEIVTAGTMIEMSADSTNLPGWNIGQYYWNFGDETISTGKEVPKTYLKPGTYNIQLIVSTENEPGAVVREACVSKNITVIRKP